MRSMAFIRAICNQYVFDVGVVVVVVVFVKENAQIFLVDFNWTGRILIIIQLMISVPVKTVEYVDTVVVRSFLCTRRQCVNCRDLLAPALLMGLYLLSFFKCMN